MKNVLFASSDIPNTVFADVVAKQEIITVGTVNVNSGNSLNMRAGNSINLQPEFSVQVEAEFSAGIEDIYDCEECASTVQKVVVQHVPVDYDMEGIQFKRKSDFLYKVFPDSSNDLAQSPSRTWTRPAMGFSMESARWLHIVKNN